MSHTPGPWFAGGMSDIFAECQEDEEGPIASVHDRDGTATDEDPIQESFANAALIAAAPELLEACKRLEKAIQSYRETGAIYLTEWMACQEQAQAAIAKATT